MSEKPIVRALTCVKNVVDLFDTLDTFKYTVKPKTIKSARGCMQVEKFPYCLTCHKIETAHICSDIECETIRDCNIVKCK
jgi:hypothetical protein